MLTSEQSIVEYEAGRAIPDRLTQTRHRHYVDYAERMLAVYRTGLGRQRRWLHQQIEAIFADEPNCPFGESRHSASCSMTSPLSRPTRPARRPGCGWRYSHRSRVSIRWFSSRTSSSSMRKRRRKLPSPTDWACRGTR